MVRWPFVGRGREFDRVASALADRGSAGVVIAGPAGVGKTRLAEECLAVAARVGFATASVTATHAAAAIPFGAFLPLLPPAHGPPPERRLDALHAVRDAVLAHGGGRPLVLAVDDAHLLDDASAALVHQLALARSAFTVVTLRSGEPVADPIVALWKDRLAERIDVAALDREEVDELLSTVLKGPVAGAAIQALWERSEGNVLFLRELVLAAQPAGALRLEGGVWRLSGPLVVPQALRELIAARFARLTERERDVLAHVALGEPLELAVAEQLAAADVLASLEAAGLIVVRPTGRRAHMRIGHPLYGEVLRRGLPELRARSIRRDLADTVERLGAHRREDALRVATWRLGSGGEIDVEIMLRATRAARDAFDLPLAERLARLALDAGGGLSAGLLLGDALTFQARYAEADRLLASLEPATDGERAILALGRSFALYWGLGRRADADTVVEDTERVVTDGAWRHELAAERAVHAAFTGDPREAIALGESLVDDPTVGARAHARAAYGLGPALVVTGRSVDAAEVTARALQTVVEVERGLTRTVFAVLLHAVEALALAESGDLTSASRTAERGYQVGVETRSATSQALGAWSLGRVALLEGRLATARRWFAESTAIERDLGLRSRQRWAPTGLALAAALSGDVAAAEESLAVVDASPSTDDRFIEVDRERARAWTDVATGDVAAARGRLQAAATAAADRGEALSELVVLHDLARLGRAGEVSVRVAALGAAVQGRLAAARVEHVEALAARDPVGLEEVARRFESTGAALFAAEAMAAAAEEYARRHEARRATACRRAADALAERCEGARTPGLARPELPVALTPREHEIAVLAAAGRTSREIADQLVVSVRTVDNHLQRVYRKLGVSSRAELRRGLGRRSVRS